MSSFESAPQPEKPPSQEYLDKTQEEAMEENARRQEFKKGFKIGADRTESFKEAGKQAEREIASRRFAALNQTEKDALIYWLFKENRLPKPSAPEIPPPPDNVVDFQEHQEQKKSAPETAPPEPPTASEPKVEPKIVEPEIIFAPPAIYRWNERLETYHQQAKDIGKELAEAAAADRINPRIHKLNPLGRALYEQYPSAFATAKEKLNKLLNQARMAATSERIGAANAYVKKDVRRQLEALEQEIFKLRAQANKLEHLKHPVRTMRKLFGR